MDSGTLPAGGVQQDADQCCKHGCKSRESGRHKDPTPVEGGILPVGREETQRKLIPQVSCDASIKIVYGTRDNRDANHNPGLFICKYTFPGAPADHQSGRRAQQENIVLFIQSHLQQDDLIVVSSPDDASVWYYSDLHGIPGAFFNTDNSTYKRVLVLVDTQWRQTLPWVLADRGPDEVQLDTESAHLLGTIGTVQVFAVPHK